MSVIVTAYENAVLNYLRGAGAPTAIAGLYLDLYNGDPQGAGTSVLSTITGSATRSSITSAMGAAASGSTTNPSTITVTSSAAAGATVTHVALFDAATGGNLLMSGALTAPKTVTVTDVVEFLASALTIALS